MKGLSVFSDAYFMKKAIEQAKLALEKNEVPIGAVVVSDNQLIAQAHNMTEHLSDCTAHAEMLAITAASEHLGGKYLDKCTLYVTLEPCPMCAGALYNARLGRLVYATHDIKRGSHLFSPSLYHPKTIVEHGLEATICLELLQHFFQSRRK